MGEIMSAHTLAAGSTVSANNSLSVFSCLKLHI
jgi:hypothetical protein